MTTYGDCNTAEVDVSADTETTIASLTIPSGLGGTIRKIRLSFGAISTTAGSVSGYLEVKMGSHNGPFRFPVMHGDVDADLGIGGSGPAEEIDVNIPCLANETVTITLTANIAVAGCNAGIVWEH